MFSTDYLKCFTNLPGLGIITCHSIRIRSVGSWPASRFCTVAASLDFTMGKAVRGFQNHFAITYMYYKLYTTYFTNLSNFWFWKFPIKLRIWSKNSDFCPALRISACCRLKAWSRVSAPSMTMISKNFQ